MEESKDSPITNAGREETEGTDQCETDPGSRLDTTESGTQPPLPSQAA